MELSEQGYVIRLSDPVYQGKLQMLDTAQFVEINPDAQLILRLPKAPRFARAHFPGVPIHSDIYSYQPPEGEFDIIICSVRVQALRTQEAERDCLIQLPLFGEKELDALSKLNPSSVLWNNEHPFVPQLMLWEHRRCSKELSDEDFAPFLADSAWQDTLGKLRQSRQQSLGQVIRDEGFLLFPTLTSNASSTNSRPAGQTKCNRWFKDNGLIPNGSQLGTKAMPTDAEASRQQSWRIIEDDCFAIAQVMGFPSEHLRCSQKLCFWAEQSSAFEELTEQYSKNQTTPSLVEPQAELEPGILQDEQLHFTHKQPSPCAESSTSTQLSDALGVLGGDEKLSDALGVLEHKRGERSSLNKRLSVSCLVKQPKQPEVKGVIRKDEGDRFLVDVDGQGISVLKLFVYPDFSTQRASDKSAKQIPPTKETAPPSKVFPTKTRRKKGDGTGYIYRRTVTRRGRQYQEFYFRYRDESGKLKAKYIPQRLLDKVQEAESAKKPIADILILLGGDEISRGEQFSTSDNKCVRRKASPLGQTDSKSDELISTGDTSLAGNPRGRALISRGEQPTPPSTKRRKQGEGTGYIECKPIKRSGKEYQQYWYHYEEWRSGDRVSKKSRYIPKRLVARVEKMEVDKVSVREILEVLTNKSKRSQK